MEKAAAIGQRILGALGLGGEQPIREPNPDQVVLASFDEENQHHEIYIDLAGGQPQLIVASNGPRPVLLLLEQLESRLDQIPDQTRRNRAQQLINLARTDFNAIPVRSYAAMRLRSRSGVERSIEREEAPLRVDEAMTRSQSLANDLRELFDIYCMGRELPQHPREGAMEMYVEITVESATGQSDLPSQLVIPPASRSGRRIGAGSAGEVIPPAQSLEGRTFVMTRSWSTGDQQRRADYTTHAERHFVSWFESQDESWRRRVRAIEVHNRPLSPCSNCTGELVALLKANPGIQTALLFWSVPYDLEPIATRPGHIAELQSAGWVVHPGPERLSSGTERCPR